MLSRRNSRPFRRGGSGRSATLPNSHHRKPGPAPGFCVFTEIRKMSDENPKPVIDLDTVFTEWNAYEARRAELQPANRSEERRVGKECVSKCRSRWSPYP